MTLTDQQIVRLGATGVRPHYDPDYLASPELVKVPANAITCLWTTDLDGVVRPFGSAYFDTELQSWVVAFRGTDNVGVLDLIEWLADAMAILVDCPFMAGGRVHLGGLKLVQAMMAGDVPIRTFIRGLTGFPVIFTGHSLGAILATMLACDYGQSAALVTFAGPLVGDDEFSHMTMSRLSANVRVVNAPDLVPKVPLRIEPLLPFMHLGVARTVDSAHLVTTNPHAWHSLDTYLHLLDPSFPLDPQFVRPVQPITTGQT